MSFDYKKLLLLVDWHATGHHPTYLLRYAEILLTLGCDLAIVCPRPELLREALCSDGWAGAISNGRVRIAKFVTPVARRFRPRRWESAVQAFFWTRDCLRAVRELEVAFGRPSEFVFFSCLYGFQSHYMERMVKSMRRPWATLHLHALTNSAKPELKLFNLLRDPRLAALGVLDETIAESLSTAIGRPVLVLPDVTNETVVENHPWEQRLRRFAGKSKLVVVAGHIRRDKGVGALAELALDCTKHDLAFAFVGSVDWDDLEAEERSILRRAMNEAPRALFHTEAVADGASYNAILRAADVIYAAFRNFPHSSNTLTKAALLQRPVIVSPGYLMADRVRRFRMGEVLVNETPAEALVAIKRITNDPAGWTSRMQPKWTEYRAMHSSAALQTSLKRLLELASPRAQPASSADPTEIAAI